MRTAVYRGRRFPVLQETGEYVVLESYGAPRRVVREDVVFDDVKEAQDVLEPELTHPDLTMTPKEEGLSMSVPLSKEIVPFKEEQPAVKKSIHNPATKETKELGDGDTLEHAIEWIRKQTNYNGREMQFNGFTPDEQEQIRKSIQNTEVKPVDEKMVLNVNPGVPTAPYASNDERHALNHKVLDDAIAAFKEQVQKMLSGTKSVIDEQKNLTMGVYEVSVPWDYKPEIGGHTSLSVVVSLYGEGLDMMDIISVKDADTNTPIDMNTLSNENLVIDYDKLEDAIDTKLMKGEYIKKDDVDADDQSSDDDRDTQDDDRHPIGGREFSHMYEKGKAKISFKRNKIANDVHAEKLSIVDEFHKELKAALEQESQGAPNLFGHKEITTDLDSGQILKITYDVVPGDAALGVEPQVDIIKIIDAKSGNEIEYGSLSHEKKQQVEGAVKGEEGIDIEEAVKPLEEQGTVAPVAGGTNQGQPNDGHFDAKIPGLEMKRRLTNEQGMLPISATPASASTTNSTPVL